jgi:Protein of unknown function (DUF2809)
MVQRFRIRKRFRFHRTSFIRFSIILLLEVIIAVFFRDQWIRPFLGDVLVVMAIAYFVHAFLAIPFRTIAIGSLILAYCIELLQFFRILDLLGWQESPLAHLTIGSTFDWRDLAAYTIGIAIVMLISPKEH